MTNKNQEENENQERKKMTKQMKTRKNINNEYQEENFKSGGRKLKSEIPAKKKNPQ